MKPNKLPLLGRINELVSYDADSGVFTWKVDRGGKAKAGLAAGSLRADGYFALCLDGKSCVAARIAWFVATGSDPDLLDVDHIDGDKCNNRISNLRLASESQNCANRKRRSDNKSGFKGVYAMGKKWAASVTSNKKRVHLGLFETPELAYSAYVSVATVKHAEFARLA